MTSNPRPRSCSPGAGKSSSVLPLIGVAVSTILVVAFISAGSDIAIVVIIAFVVLAVILSQATPRWPRGGRAGRRGCRHTLDPFGGGVSDGCRHRGGAIDVAVRPASDAAVIRRSLPDRVVPDSFPANGSVPDGFPANGSVPDRNSLLLDGSPVGVVPERSFHSTCPGTAVLRLRLALAGSRSVRPRCANRHRAACATTAPGLLAGFRHHGGRRGRWWIAGGHWCARQR